MSEIITKGYLIDKHDFQTFDEIITFINEFGNKFVCIAQGTRKIESKNGRNLLLGNYCEFQFFLARNEDKVSKLMKANAITRVEWPIYRQSFVTLNALANQLIYPDTKNYKFYEQMLPYATDKLISDAKAELIILRNYCSLTGIDLHVDDCVLCHNHHIKTISFEHKGLVCGQCAEINHVHNFDLQFSKLFYHLFRNEYDKMDRYSEYYLEALKYLKQYIVDNNGTYFIKKARKNK